MRIASTTACLVFLTGVAASANTLDEDMYCGLDDCYDVLGLERPVTDKDVKKMYRKLSKLYHPDRNPDKDAHAMFLKIVVAYEVLGDTEARENYDYYLDHPEERWRNKYNYYRFKYAPKTDPRLVISGFVIVVTVIQYFSARQRYSHAMYCLRFDKRVLKKAQELARSSMVKKASNKRSSSSSKRPTKDQIDRAIDQILENSVEINGGFGKPSWRNTLAAWILFFPVTMYTVMRENARWFYLYTILKRPYEDADRTYLTKKRLVEHRMTTGPAWMQMDEVERQRLIEKELWKPKNMATYKREINKELLEKRGGRYKKYLRYMKKQQNRA